METTLPRTRRTGRYVDAAGHSDHGVTHLDHVTRNMLAAGGRTVYGQCSRCGLCLTIDFNRRGVTVDRRVEQQGDRIKHAVCAGRVRLLGWGEA